VKDFAFGSTKVASAVHVVKGATLEQVLQHAESTIEACEYGQAIEAAIPVLKQALRSGIVHRNIR
jgi:hypothetical protein